MMRIFIFVLPFLFAAHLSFADDPPQENQSEQPTSSSEKPFQLMVVPLGEGGAAIARCNTSTGEASYSLGDKWVFGVDSGQLPNSLYLCRAVPFQKASWRFVRMDVNTGATWILKGEHWQRVLP